MSKYHKQKAHTHKLPGTLQKAFHTDSLDFFFSVLSYNIKVPTIVDLICFNFFPGSNPSV